MIWRNSFIKFEHFHLSTVIIDSELGRRSLLIFFIFLFLSTGEVLLARVVEEEERIHLRDVLTKLHDERSSIEEILNEHQLRLDLCLQLRLYEADVSIEH